MSKSSYVRNAADLRVVSEIVKIYIGEVLGTSLQVEKNNITQKAMSMEYEMRPFWVALLVTMLEPEACPLEFPDAKEWAEMILERKIHYADKNGNVDALQKTLCQNIIAWYREKQKDENATLRSKSVEMIAFYSETIVHCAELYKVWLAMQKNEQNLSFDLRMLNVCINSLRSYEKQLTMLQNTSC